MNVRYEATEPIWYNLYIGKMSKSEHLYRYVCNTRSLVINKY